MMKPSDHPVVIWLTGLPAAGKTTLGEGIARMLKEMGVKVEHLDGDRVRRLYPATGYSREERDQHIRRVGYMAGMLEKNGTTVVASFISPYREAREFVRSQCNRFIEVHVSTPLEECEKRDPKGLYARARKGEIKNLTGVDDPYEPPENPDLRIDTSGLPIKDCIERIMELLDKQDMPRNIR